MKWIEGRVEYNSDNLEIARDIISDIFYDIGVQGVALEEPMGKNKLDYYSDEKISFFDSYAVKGYFPKNNYIESKIKYFEEAIKERCAKENIEYNIKYTELDEKEWEESWKKYFNPEKITERIVVKPTWKDYTPVENEVIIEIDPGMAFGTGTHPTTYLCMNMIEKYMKEGDRVLDIGTGSGILMLAAAKLGAKDVTGTDIDDMAVDVAISNLELNKVDKSKYKVVCGNLAEVLENEKFDLIVSNILAEIIVILLDDITNFISKNGLFIFSGIIKEKSKIVESKMVEKGIEIIEYIEKDEWVSLVGRSK